MPPDRPFLVRHADLIFALKTFGAAILAFVIALWIDLPRPSWAMATVYITSQPLAGGTSAKAIYRLLGTVIGAVAAMAMVPSLVNVPELLCLAIALWVGLCLCLALLDGTARSYAFLLSGYTAAIIAFPSVSDPGSIFDTAIARVQEISLGIICAAVISGTVFPQSSGTVISERLDYWLATAAKLSREALAGSGVGQEQHLQRLLREAVEIEAMESHLDHDRLTDIEAARGLRILRRHMLMLVPILASINDRIAALGPRLRDDEPDLARLFERLSAWIADDGSVTQPTLELSLEIEARRLGLSTDSSWDQVLIVSLLIRLLELADLLQDCRLLRSAIDEGRDPSRVTLRFDPEAGAEVARHRDPMLAIWSAAATAIAILLCCAFWIGTGWHDGASAPMMAAVACSIFASRDDPAIGMRSFGGWAVVAIIVAGIYLFALLPRISDIEVVVVALAPTLVLFGYLIARPSTTAIGTALAVNFATMLALQSTYQADFAAFVNSAIAFVLGISAAIAVMRTLRSIRTEWIVARLLRKGWVALALAAEHRGKRDRANFVGAMLARLDQLVQRLAAIPEIERRDVENLGQLRVGLNIIDLRRARHQLSENTVRAIDGLLDRLAATFRAYPGGAMPESLLADIDTTLTAVVDDPGAGAKEDALIGLVGIRRGLFPQAPPYMPQSPVIAMQLA
ncbi:FUSC family protein [Bosea sp. 2RAB26]|uniref:FUSC family protein n=1 Tax=Bosea sp. 2RAB26 TaxID=3237476 RepID=UPI003F91FAF0